MINLFIKLITEVSTYNNKKKISRIAVSEETAFKYITYTK